LFDDIENEKNLEEFTEEDLGIEHKSSSKIDQYNPYANPNLDSDLSETIGKLSKSIVNRK
jgi:hypothetical protein